MNTTQPLRLMLSYSMIGSLCIQRLGMQLLILASIFFVPAELGQQAMAHQHELTWNQRCSTNTEQIGVIAELSAHPQSS